ncbi:MAG: leucine-rich repeat domain-containing protein [Bacteroidales bacterium]|nr:leucine-rich repeat domain-containing protein [Bacteroidales bacterium]
MDGIFYTYLSQADKTVSVSYQGSSYNELSDEYSGDVVIPSSVTYNGTTYSVTSIGDWTFGSCTGLTSIEIPNSVNSIGDRAFYYCKGLTSVEIPSSVTSIGEYAFWGCTGLTRVEITSVESICRISFGNTFANPLYYAHHLYIGDKEITEIVIPSSVTGIGECAFSGCTGLTSIEIPSSVTSIGDYAFSGCTGLTSIEIPSSVTSIGSAAFSGCTGLTSIEIPSSVTSIGSNAFQNCTGLTSIEIPSSVTSIGNGAFYGCTRLTSIEIPSSVTSIGSNAFSRVKNVIYSGNAEGSTWGALTVNGIVDGDFVYSDAEKTQLTAYIGSGGDVVVPSSVTSIGDYAFQDCKGVTSVVIPNSVTSIGSYAFSGCTVLTSIEIPSSVTSIGDDAFYYCTGLTSIEIPSSVTSIGSYAFYHVKNIIYSGSAKGSPWGALTVNGIVDGVFIYSDAEMTQLTAYIGSGGDVVVPSSVTSIGSRAFYGCTGLTSIQIPSCVTSIGNSAFSSCTGLTSIEIPSSVTSIGQEAFYGCTGLTSVTALNPTPVSIASYVFPNRANATLYVPTGSKAAYEAADYWKEFKEIVEIEVLDRLIITDGEALAYNQTETHDELVYTRTFSSADKWQALYVPFSIPIDTLDKYGLQVAELNDTHMYDTDDDGEFDQTTLEFLYLKRGATQPNYPYLIKSASAGDVTLTMTDVEVKATEETEIECSTTRAVFKIRGTYAGVSGAVMYVNNYYAMGGGALVRMANADSGLKPQRWYLAVENKDGSPAESLAATMRISIDGIEIEESETAISEVNAIGQKQDEVYMLDGRKLNGTAALKSGLYVKNHKKLFVR